VLALTGSDAAASCREVSDWFLPGTAPRRGCDDDGWDLLPGVGSGPRWPWSRR
jgi:hypothetical protein